jgi:hypothetical protein
VVVIHHPHPGPVDRQPDDLLSLDNRLLKNIFQWAFEPKLHGRFEAAFRLCRAVNVARQRMSQWQFSEILIQIKT